MKLHFLMESKSTNKILTYKIIKQDFIINFIKVNHLDMTYFR